jgi:hypothetical protein
MHTEGFCTAQVESMFILHLCMIKKAVVYVFLCRVVLLQYVPGASMQTHKHYKNIRANGSIFIMLIEKGIQLVFCQCFNKHLCY